jgi:hypothetical protein
MHIMRDYLEDSNGYVGGACHVSLSGGKYSFVYCNDECNQLNGACYQERTDSKEYVNLERISEAVHNAWWGEKKRQGRDNHPDAVPYYELSEEVKEYDRQTAITVLNAVGVRWYKPSDYTYDDVLDDSARGIKPCPPSYDSVEQVSKDMIKYLDETEALLMHLCAPDDYLGRLKRRLKALGIEVE